MKIRGGMVLLGMILATGLLAENIYLSRSVEDINAAPYRSTGKVTIPRKWRGSGVVSGSEFSFFTAGHVIYDSVDKRWIAEAIWEAPSEARQVVVRNFRVLSAYADAVNNQGGNSYSAFREDTAVGFAYEPLSQFPASRSGTPIEDLISNKEKLITGYSIFHSGQGVSGPFTNSFNQALGDFYHVDDVSLGSGGSGGGLWVQSSGEWELAGIYVAGSDTRSGDARNSAGVVALTPEKVGLMEDALAQLVLRAPEILEAPSEIAFNEELVAEARVVFSGHPAPQAQWEHRSGGSSYDWYTGVSTDGNSTTLRLNRSHGVANQSEFRIILTNSLGSVVSNWIPVSYLDLQLPYFNRQPQDLSLARYESGIFSAEVSGHPTPQFQWQVQRGDGSYSDAHMLEGDSTEQLLIPEDNLYYADNVFRLKAWNEGGVAYSDPVLLTVPIPEMDGSYIGTPDDYLEFGESFSLGLNVISEFTNYWTVWRITYPHGSIRETNGPYGFDTLSWISATEEVGSGIKVTVTNTGNIQNGTILQGIIRRVRLNYGFDSIVEEFKLDPIRLYADGPSWITSQPKLAGYGSGMGVKLIFSASPEAKIEWQLWDEVAGVWRPVNQQHGWLVESGEHYSRLKRLEGGAVVRLRGVLHGPDSTVISDEMEVIFPTAGPSSLRTFQYPLDKFTYLESIASSDRLYCLLRANDNSGYKYLALQKFNGNWELKEEIVVNPGIHPTVMGSHDGNLLLGDFLEASGPGEHRGALNVFTRDLLGQWRLQQKLRIPDQVKEGVFPKDIWVIGDTLVVSSIHTGVEPQPYGPPISYKFLHLFRRDGTGLYQLVRSIEKEAPDLPDSWTGYVSSVLPYHEGFLMSARLWEVPPQGGYDEGVFDLVYVRYDVPSQAYKLNTIGKTREVPRVAVAPDELGAVEYHPSLGMVWHRILLDGTQGILEDFFDVPPPTVNAFMNGDGRIVWTQRSYNSSYLWKEDPVTLYRLSSNGRLEGPATIIPPDWDFKRPYTAGDLVFGAETIFVVNDTNDELRIDLVPKRSLNFTRTDTVPAVWSLLARRANTNDWGIQYRQKKGGTPVEVYYSHNLVDWIYLPSGDSFVIEPDVDGDGNMELREINLPSPTKDRPLFYRLLEASH